MSNTLVNISLGFKDSAWFIANQALVLLPGQHVYLSDGTASYLSAYKNGDGITTLDNLPWKGIDNAFGTQIIGEISPIIGNTALLYNIPIIGTNSHFLNGMRCGVGVGYRILSIVDNAINFDGDYTGGILISDYKFL